MTGGEAEVQSEGADTGRSGAPAVGLPARITVIAIGASAGGVEALMAILPALPATLPAAVFVVLHLPRERSSVLATLFAPRCAMRVREAEDKLPVERGTIYFAPADYHLLIDRGPTLALSADEPVHYSRPSVDVLFDAAADCYGPALAAIVLTGANDDGAAGLATVAREGGVTIVQDPLTARMPAMPSAALRRVQPDFVLPIAAIADLVAHLGVARDETPA